MSNFVMFREPFIAAQCMTCRQKENTNYKRNADPEVATSADGSATVPLFAEYCATLSDLVVEVARHTAIDPDTRSVPNLLLLYVGDNFERLLRCCC